MKHILVWVVLLGAASVFAQPTDPVNPGSLFQPAFQNPFLDRLARRVGDTLTIVISEQSTSQFAASTETAKQDTHGIETQFFNELLDRLIRPIMTSASGSGSGRGTTQYNSRMNTRMSAMVKQVLPNGNLLVEGRRTLVTNRQTQTFLLTGIVRPEDVRADNSVRSEQIAEAQIRMEGSGSIMDRQRKGLLTQLVDWLF